jgi:hypothetical protein
MMGAMFSLLVRKRAWVFGGRANLDVEVARGLVCVLRIDGLVK